jgi:hypothetical protein
MFGSPASEEHDALDGISAGYLLALGQIKPHQLPSRAMIKQG